MKITKVHVSAIAISIALVGICLNLIVTIPSTRHAILNSGTFERNDKAFERKVLLENCLANIGNVLLIIGTIGQIASVFMKSNR